MKTIYKTKNIFIPLLTLYIFTREIIPLNFLIDNMIATVIFFALSIFYIGLDLLNKRYCLKTDGIILLIIFIAVSVVSSVINFKYGIFENLKAIGILLIYIFFIYPISENQRLTIIKTLYFALSIFVILSVVMYIFNIDYVYLAKSGHYLNQGFSNQYMRLWGLFADPNAAAVYCLCAITFSVMILKKEKSTFLKTLIIILDLFNFLYVILSGSRTAVVIIIVMTLWAVVLYTRSLSYKTIIKIGLSVFALTLSAITVTALFLGVKTALPYLRQGINKTTPQKSVSQVHKLYDSFYSKVQITSGKYDITSSSPPVFSQLDRTDTEKEDVTNGRILRWKAGLQVFKKAFIIGCSPRGSVNFAKEKLEDSLVAKSYSIHNCYIEIPAYTGILGSIPIFLFLVLTALKILKSKITFNNSIFSTTALIMAVSAFFFADMLFYFLTLGGLIFWISIGNFCEGEQNGNLNLRS